MSQALNPALGQSIEKVAQTAGHAVRATLASKEKKFDTGLQAMQNISERGYPTAAEVQALIRLGDIEPLAMLSNGVKNMGYEWLDEQYQAHPDNTLLRWAGISADTLASTAIDYIVPTNVLDLAGNAGKIQARSGHYQTLETSTQRLFANSQHHKSQVRARAANGQISPAQARQDLDKIEKSTAEQFGKLVNKSGVNDLLLGRLILTSATWTTWNTGSVQN